KYITCHVGRIENASEAMVSGLDDAPFAGARRRQDMETVLLQFGGDFAHALAGNGIGLDVAVNDKDGEFQVFVHGGFLKTPAFRVEASCTSSKQTAETLSGRLRLGFHRLLQLSPERRGASRFLDGRQTRRMGGQFVIAGADDS